MRRRRLRRARASAWRVPAARGLWGSVCGLRPVRTGLQALQHNQCHCKLPARCIHPICEPLGTTKAECHNASALEAYDPQHGGMPQAKEANLSAFLHRIRGIYSGRVPPDFEGVCNIDFEGCKSARSPIFSSLASA